jgi:hypothetical protein
MSPTSRRRAWLWAVGTLLTVALILAGTYAGHRYVAAKRLAAAQAPAPATPPAAVLTTLHPEAGAAFVAPAGPPGRLVALAGSQVVSCPPVGSCDPAPLLDALLLMDSASGATLARTPLTGDAQRPVALAVDARQAVVDVVSAHTVAVFSAVTGAAQGVFSLPTPATTGAYSGAAVSTGGVLLLTANQAGQFVALGLDDQSGALRFTRTLAAATSLDGPVYDAGADRAFVLRDAGGSAILAAYSAADGSPHGTWTVPSGSRLGPLDTARQALYLLEPNGATASLALASLRAAPLSADAAPVPAQPTSVPWLRGAVALGWNATLGHFYVADTGGFRILDAASGATLAALPLTLQAPPHLALPVDETTGTVALPAEHGAVVVVRDARGQPAGPTTPGSELLLARIAFTRLVSQGSQTPPFISDSTFLPGPGTLDVPFWTYDSVAGWQSASPGRAVMTVAPASACCGYDVAFTVTWTQHSFRHVHTAVFRVAPNGAVQLLRDGGDALP